MSGFANWQDESGTALREHLATCYEKKAENHLATLTLVVEVGKAGYPLSRLFPLILRKLGYSSVQLLLENVMTIDRTVKSHWGLALLQLALLSLLLVVLFAVVYWGVDALNWGRLEHQNGDRAIGFLPFLFFSVETFFRIGYGNQSPVGAVWLIITLEALSHLLIEVVFIAHLVILGLSKLTGLSDRTRLENTLKRF